MSDNEKRNTMNRILNTISGTLLALCILSSCTKEPAAVTMNNDFVGDWHLAELEYDGSIMDNPIDVYLTINSDCTFELYMKNELQSRYTKFTGTCRLEGGILSGTYSSGTEWGDAYEASVEGDMLVLVSSDLIETQRFESGSLSDDEKKNADISTKSSPDGIIPVL